MKKKWTVEYYKKQLRLAVSSVQLKGPFKGLLTRTLHNCEECSSEWLCLPSTLLKSKICPFCSRDAVYRNKLQQLNPTIKFLGKLFQGKKKQLHLCTVCSHKWKPSPSNVLGGHGCPICSIKVRADKNRITIQEYRARLAKLQPTVKFLGNAFQGMKTHQLHLCLICNLKWKTSPVQALSINGCPECSKLSKSNKMKFSAEQVRESIKAKHGNRIRMLGQYRGRQSIHRFKCYECLSTWKTTLNRVVYRKVACPVCVGQISKRNASKSAKIKELTIDGVHLRVQGYEPQAIHWILKNKTLTIHDLVLDASGEVPVIPYIFGRRRRNYYPDIFIPKYNRIVEVKSTYTFGLTTGRGWRKNVAKARACIAAGYKFTLMIMHPSKGRFMLPDDWYTKSRSQLLLECAILNADESPIVPRFKET